MRFSKAYSERIAKEKRLHESQVGESKVGGEAHEEGDSNDGGPIDAVESLP